jgi:RimJ/RimL family protein N-acetyltransferase
MLPATVFETNRLRIRHLLESDFDAFHEMQSDAEVMRYTTGSSLDEVENRRQLKMCIECYAKPENDFWVWAITRKVDGQFVGTCAITPNDQRAEIGYRLLRKTFWPWLWQGGLQRRGPIRNSPAKTTRDRCLRRCSKRGIG